MMILSENEDTVKILYCKSSCRCAHYSESRLFILTLGKLLINCISIRNEVKSSIIYKWVTVYFINRVPSPFWWWASTEIWWPEVMMKETFFAHSSSRSKRRSSRRGKKSCTFSSFFRSSPEFWLLFLPTNQTNHPSLSFQVWEDPPSYFCLEWKLVLPLYFPLERSMETEISLDKHRGIFFSLSR